MLKHCHATAVDRGSTRSRNSKFNSSSSSSSTTSNCSLNSSIGGSSSSSFEADNFNNSRRSSYSSPFSLASRASSFVSLNQQEERRVPIKIFAKCLRSDIEYKTLSVSPRTTAKELIWMLLSKYKMKHRDPKLFYLSMDISIRRTGIPISRTLILDDDARPAELKSCHPWGECKFSLQMRKGGLVRIYDSVLMEESKYKCLLISETTTVKEIIKILFHCYGLERLESVDRYCLVEQCKTQSYERRLHPDDAPAQVQSLWPSPSQFMFVLRRENKVSVLGSAGVSPVSESSDPDVHMEDDDDDDDDEYSDSSSSSVASSTPRYYRAQQTFVLPKNKGNFVMPSSSAISAAAAIRTGSQQRSLPIIPPPPSNYYQQQQQQQPPATPPPPPPPPRPVSISIHESGLPRPVLRPKLRINGENNKRASFGSLSSDGSSSTTFHDYENYFYI